jgi:hypothetical protein
MTGLGAAGGASGVEELLLLKTAAAAMATTAAPAIKIVLPTGKSAKEGAQTYSVSQWLGQYSSWAVSYESDRSKRLTAQPPAQTVAW